MRTAAAILVAVLRALPAAAATAPGTPEGARQRQAAELAGRNRDMAALRGYVDRRDADGISQFRSGFSVARDGSEPLPGDIESLVAAHIADPAIGREMAGFLLHGTYGSRQLFDVLLARTREEFAAGRVPDGHYPSSGLLVHTRLTGIESQVHEVLAEGCLILPPGRRRAGDVTHCEKPTWFLVARKHEPTREWLERQLADPTAHHRDGIWIVRAVGRYGDSRAMEALLAHLEAVAPRLPVPDLKQRGVQVVSALRGTNSAVPIDYARLRRALSRVPPAEFVEQLAELVAVRGDARGADMLVSFLDMPPDPRWSSQTIVRALRATESPEAWRSARAQIRALETRAALKPAQKEALRALDQLVAEADQAPEREAQYRQKEDAVNRFGPYAAPLIEARRLVATDPEKAGMLYRRVIDEMLERDRRSSRPGGGVGFQSLGMVILEAAVHDRYRRRNPRAAVELLRLLVKISADAPRENWPALPHWRIADILHFDLGDRAGAAREMRAEAARARRALRDAKEEQRRHLQGIAEWMEAEAAFLEGGKAMSGRPSEAMRAAIGQALVFDSDPAVPPPLVDFVHEGPPPEEAAGAPYRASLRAALGGLPPSRGNALRALRWIGLFPDEDSIRRFLDRHDPAGAVTLMLLELVTHLDRAKLCRNRRDVLSFPGLCDDPARPHPAQEAARKILASRGAPGAAAAVPDARWGTPEATWAAFIAALRAGDRQAALACMTPELRDRFRSVLQSLDAARMRAMADEFSPLTMGKPMGLFQEAFVTRDRGGKKQAAVVYFLRQGGEWRINEM